MPVLEFGSANHTIAEPAFHLICHGGKPDTNDSWTAVRLQIVCAQYSL
jgi:hypothetical protein